MNKITPDNFKRKLMKYKPNWCSFYISFSIFIMLGASKPKLGKDRLAYIVEGLLGWLILGLFIVTLANKMIR
jgi:hypothetical protein